jgi:hypothetical protein
MTRNVLTAAVALACFAGAAFAQDISQFNAYRMEARLFNDFATSALTINGANQPVPNTYAIPAGPLHINEQFPQGTTGNFANKHVGWISTDGGATNFGTSQFQSWSMSFNVNLNAAAGSPRKEAGIQFNQPRPGLGYTDEGQLLIASDGEVAVFGATMPFTGFGPTAYTLGTTAQVTFSYFAPGIHDPTKGAYQLIFVDAVTGLHDSGIKIWGTEPDGIVGFNNASLGFKLQNQRNPFTNDFGDALYSNVSIVPSPAGLALLGLAGLGAARRRR